MRFYLKNAPSEINEWSGNANVPYINPCLYYVLYGRQDDFYSFPYPDNKAGAFAFSVKEGMDAYRFLIQTVSGYRSRDKGETHSRRQFYDGWRKFQEDNKDLAKHYQRFVADVKHDVGYLQDKVAADLQKTKHEIVVRDLSGIAKGEKSLVIGHVLNGKLGEHTKNMIRIIENKQDPSGKKRQGSNYICMTHPDPEALDAMKKQISELTRLKQIGSNIEFCRFGDLGEQVVQCDKVYVALPMGHDAMADAKIIEAWTNRNRVGNMLTHVSGIPKKLMESTDLWLKACIRDDCILPEDIVDEIGRRAQINKQVVRAVFNASYAISELRYKGDQDPVATIEEKDSEAEQHFEARLHLD